MTRQQVLFGYGLSADRGQVSVVYRDLFPGSDDRPTETDPNNTDVPVKTLQLLNIRGQYFLPVYTGMWFGAFVYHSGEGSIMALGTLRRTDDDWSQNLWRAGEHGIVGGDPNAVEDTLGWEIGSYRGVTIASQVDRQRRRDPSGGRIYPFVVRDTDGIPTVTGDFDELTIWRRNRRTLAGATSVDDPLARGTGKFAQNAAMVGRVTLIWRDTAEQILRATGVVADGEPVYWSQP